MLERYFVRPATVDRIRASWIGGPIEQYVTSLADNGYAARNVFCRVPLLVQFGEFARERGATHANDLPAHVDAFVELWTEQHGASCKTIVAKKKVASTVRNPIEQMLHLAVPGFHSRPRARWARAPFEGRAARFFEYLTEERGLRLASILHYKNHLGPFEAYLDGIGCHEVAAISAPILGGFVVDSAGHLCPTSVRNRCGVLRVFLRYLHREGLTARDLSQCVEMSRSYRLSSVPRSIAWDDVRRMLEAIDRRTVAGRRDYAILVLLVTYGLRGRAMLEAMIAGVTDPERLATLAQGTARKKQSALVEALRGRVTDHHRALLRLHLQLVDALQAALQEIDTTLGKALAPIQQAVRRLTTMPGLGDIATHVIVAEIGLDMERFPTPGTPDLLGGALSAQ